MKLKRLQIPVENQQGGAVLSLRERVPKGGATIQLVLSQVTASLTSKDDGTCHRGTYDDSTWRIASKNLGPKLFRASLICYHQSHHILLLYPINSRLHEAQDKLPSVTFPFLCRDLKRKISLPLIQPLTLYGGS